MRHRNEAKLDLELKGCRGGQSDRPTLPVQQSGRQVGLISAQPHSVHPFQLLLRVRISQFQGCRG